MESQNKEEMKVLMLDSFLIQDFWDPIKYSVETCLGPIDAEHLLTKILTNLIQVWIAFEENQVKAIFTSCIVEDDVTNERTLLLYSAYGFAKSSDELWFEVVKTMKAYAKKVGCKQLAAYTKVDKVIKKLTEAGGNAEVRYVILEV